MWIAANVPSQSKLHEWMATQEDLSIRLGHYYSFDTDNPEELERRFDRDGREFIEAATSNNNLYQRENVRSRLRELIDKDCHSRGQWLELDLFKSQLEKLAQEDPQYLSAEKRQEREATLLVTIGTLRRH
jgi:hypothetical protein